MQTHRLSNSFEAKLTESFESLVAFFRFLVFLFTFARIINMLKLASVQVTQLLFYNLFNVR
jgi:hypothetical protein